MTWKLLSDGDRPDVGAIISMVIYREEDTSVVIYKRMRVSALVRGGAGTGIYGPHLPGGEEFELPARPEPLFGTAVFWRSVE